LSANTEDLYDGCLVRIIDLEGTLNEVGSGFDSFPAVTSDEEYAMDLLLEFVPPGWFVVIWVAYSGHLTAGVVEELCIGKLPCRERTKPARRRIPPGFIEHVRDAEFLETKARESNIGACNRD